VVKSLTGATHVETEFKFRVPTLFDFPSFPSSLGSWTDESVRNMDATYWDTTDATLLRWGITMRIRTGGGDDGWHLKIPTSATESVSGASVRTELHRDGSSASPPVEFLELLSAILQGSEVVPIARVHTERKPKILSDSRGALIELVDDLVTLSRGAQIIDEFREIEIELINDTSMPEALVIGEILGNAGAQSSSVSKAASAFGPAAKKQPDIPLLPKPVKGDLPCDLIRWALSRQVRRIFHAELSSKITNETLILTAELENLEDLLTALQDWLMMEEQEFLREDLTWLSRELSIGVELSQQNEIANAAIDSLSEPRDHQEASLAVEKYFAGKSEAARSSLQAARRSDRYLFLFSDLLNLARVPAVIPQAYELNSIWDRISTDPCDQLTVATHFEDIFKKKSKNIRKNLQCAKTLSQDTNVGELMRTIALSGQNDSAAIFALGLALAEGLKQ
jgi:inorganic triphosphatase YgiF